MTTMSVILNTARTGHAMIGLKDQHHFAYTICALRRQSMKDIELIISDYLYGRRRFDWNSLGDVGFPIYHVPITHSVAKDSGYVAISAGKNNGIMYSEGRLLFFLDDCCSFPSDLLRQIVWIIDCEGTFPNPLHVKQKGIEDYRDANGNPIRDCRYVYFDHYKSDKVTDCFHMYGYSSMTIEAALKVNGFDENFDFSRQLEDIDMGERLKAAGYSISLHKNMFVAEQEHLQIASTPVGKPGQLQANCEISDEVAFMPNLKCNGPVLWIKSERVGPDKYLANHRPYRDDEKRRINPCYLLDGVKCNASNANCNWMDEHGQNLHMKRPEALWWLENPSVFNLSKLRQEKLTSKNQFKVK